MWENARILEHIIEKLETKKVATAKMRKVGFDPTGPNEPYVYLMWTQTPE